MENNPQVDFEESNTNQLAVIVEESKLPQTKAKYILERFQDYFTMADQWAQTTKQIVVTDDSQTHMMDMARAARLAIREKRLAVEKSRKELKADILREGKAIDGIANVLFALLEPLEEYYRKQECFVEIKAAQKAELIAQEVQARLDAEFEAEQKRKAEEEQRLREENETLKEQAYQKEKELMAERKRVADEQEKIKKENEAKIAKERAEQQAKLDLVRKEQESKLAKERVEQEKKLAQEREERAKVEKELRDEKFAKQKAEQERIINEENLKKADDSTKLKVLMSNIINIKMPGDLKSKDSEFTCITVMKLLSKAVDELKSVIKEEEVDF